MNPTIYLDNGFLKVTGNDAKKLLQGQLTCDVEKVNAGHDTLGAHCNPQGRIISLFNLFYFQNAYYLMMPRDLISIALAALKKYALFYKVELADVSDELKSIGYDNSSTNHENIYCLKSPDQTRSILIGKPDFLERIIEKNQDNIISPNKWKHLDIQLVIPHIYASTSGQFLPHDLNLPALNAVDFDKGCYTGQEIIARMHYRGKLKNHLYKAMITTPTDILPGMTIFSQDESRVVGNIVDVCKDENDTQHVLLVTSAFHSNQTLTLENGTQQFSKISE